MGNHERLKSGLGILFTPVSLALRTEPQPGFEKSFRNSLLSEYMTCGMGESTFWEMKQLLLPSGLPPFSVILKPSSNQGMHFSILEPLWSFLKCRCWSHFLYTESEEGERGPIRHVDIENAYPEVGKHPFPTVLDSSSFPGFFLQYL